MRILRSFGRAMLLRCPNCGSRGVVKPLARVAETCPQCRHRFEREEGYWLGAIMLSTVAAMGLFVVMFVLMTVLTWPDVPWTAVLIITITVMAVFPVVFHPWARMIWVALDLAVHPTGEDGA